MPWDSVKPNLGFSSGSPWLPLGPAHAGLAVSAQEGDPNSALVYARQFLKTRKSMPDLVTGDLALLDAPQDLVVFVRGGRILCLFNLGDAPQSFSLPRPATGIALGTAGAELSANSVHLPPFSAWFGQLVG
jgi:alpha-glucosidase